QIVGMGKNSLQAKSAGPAPSGALRTARRGRARIAVAASAAERIWLLPKCRLTAQKSQNCRARSRLLAFQNQQALIERRTLANNLPREGNHEPTAIHLAGALAPVVETASYRSRCGLHAKQPASIIAHNSRCHPRPPAAL